MVLVSTLMRRIHPLIIFKMADVHGGMPFISALAIGPWRQHFDDESWRGSGYAFLAESTFCVSLFCAAGSIPARVVLCDGILPELRRFFDQQEAELRSQLRLKSQNDKKCGNVVELSLVTIMATLNMLKVHII